jgi:Fe-S oxidoreductase
LGMTDQRPFPKFAKRKNKLTQHSTVGQRTQHQKRIIFLSDVFSRYIEPDVEQAAIRALSAAGFDVQMLPVVGAGASFLSKGFVEQAQHHASHVLNALNQIDPAYTTPIIGIEPPEIYCLKHDYADLLPTREDEVLRRIADTWLLDQFLLRSEAFEALRVAKKLAQSQPVSHSLARKIRFHPHCHQRAEGPAPDGMPTGTTATLELLRRCGYDVELMDTGCCGMAGTFGYEAEHYDLSMRVGELKLFPLLRDIAASGDANPSVVASGAACRMQIRQGTGVQALHPILLVAKLLDEENSYDEK